MAVQMPTTNESIKLDLSPGLSEYFVAINADARRGVMQSTIEGFTSVIHQKFSIRTAVASLDKGLYPLTLKLRLDGTASPWVWKFCLQAWQIGLSRLHRRLPHSAAPKHLQSLAPVKSVHLNQGLSSASFSFKQVDGKCRPGFGAMHANCCMDHVTEIRWSVGLTCMLPVSATRVGMKRRFPLRPVSLPRAFSHLPKPCSPFFKASPRAPESWASTIALTYCRCTWLAKTPFNVQSNPLSWGGPASSRSVIFPQMADSRI